MKNEQGRYVIWIDGEGWIAVEWDGARVVSFTEKSCAATHIAAKDRWAHTCSEINEGRVESVAADLERRIIDAYRSEWRPELMTENAAVEMVGDEHRAA